MVQSMSNSLQAQRALLQPLGQSNRHARPCRAVTHQVRAGLVLPQNPIGIHSGVFVGDWKPQDAERAIKGAKEAGYDLIERRYLLTTEQNMYFLQCFSMSSMQLFINTA